MKKILLPLALLISFSSFGQTAKEYYDSGIKKEKNGNYYGAIADFNKSIELDSDYGLHYFNRALAKRLVGDKKGACEDARKSGSLGYPFPKMIADACN